MIHISKSLIHTVWQSYDCCGQFPLAAGGAGIDRHRGAISTEMTLSVPQERCGMLERHVETEEQQDDCPTCDRRPQ